MRSVLGVSSCLLLLLLTGCVPSLHPFCTDKDLVLEPALEGKWAGGDQEEWVFARRGARAYTLTHTDKHGSAVFEVKAFRLGDRLFLDTFPEKVDCIKNELLEMHALGVHYAWRFRIEGKTASLATLNYDPVNDLMKAGKFPLPYEEVEGGWVVTAKTEALQAFLRSASDDVFFAKSTRLERR
jgi:hypothetical protein